jgi:transposase, IS30 family
MGESERRRIERLLGAGKSLRNVAKALDRAPGVICREVNSNGGKERYRADRAQKKAERRRKHSKLQCMKVAMNPALKEYVTARMEKSWSPEVISGRLKEVDTHIECASTKAIYKFVYSPHGRKIETHLLSKRRKKHGGPKRGTRKVTLDGRTMIGKRPAHIDNREEFGHFEGDLMESGRDGKGSLVHLVERKTRYPFLEPILKKSTSAINELACRMIKHTDPESLTLDNDLVFARHRELSELLETAIYFCEPYHSWEKGTVENRNGIVRIDIPKGTDLSTISYEKIKEIEHAMRNRPMKVLGYKTPQECWDEEMMKRDQRRGLVQEKSRATLPVLSTFTKRGCST